MENLIGNLTTYMSVERISEEFSIPCRMTWKLIKDGDIEASRVGRQWKVKTKSVLLYLKRRRNVVKEEINV